MRKRARGGMRGEELVMDRELTALATLPLNEDGASSERPDESVEKKYASLIDLQTGSIGRVVGSEDQPAGAHLFYFWADSKVLSLDIGHIVVTFSEEAAVIG